MFGARVVRQKRERERQDRLARDLDGPVIPYIKGSMFRYASSDSIVELAADLFIPSELFQFSKLPTNSAIHPWRPIWKLLLTK